MTRDCQATRGLDSDKSASEDLRTKARWALLRPAADAVAAFALCVVVAAAINSAPLYATPSTGLTATMAREAAPVLSVQAIANAEPAAIVEIATTSSPNSANAVFRRTSAEAAWVLIALAFSVLAALNMAVFRHLRRAYAVPQRRVGPAQKTRQ